MSRRVVLSSVVVLAAVAGALALACAPENDETELRSDVLPPPSVWIPAPLDEAYCEILVEGQGVKDMETDYLPHVITCENGGANLEALKAQAIAARSVAYYYAANQGSVCDSQGCQVYSCNAEPSAKAYQAVEETSGMYLNYNEVLTYAFYVAGDSNTSPPQCVGDVNVGTEHWVTYNEGQSGAQVEQTALGFVFDPNDNGFGQNRGCMSQWGARCLENNNDYSHEDILAFYYGEDTILTQAQGACVNDLGDGDGDPGDGDPGDGDPGDGDPGDGDPGPDPEDCSIGSLGCMCTMGGGCDPGLICLNGYCVPEAPSEDGGDEMADEDTGGFRDDAFTGEASCECSAQARSPGSGALAGLALLGLLGWTRRRRLGACE